MVERAPKPGTKTDVIVTHLRNGVASSVIEDALGVSKAYVGAVKTDAIRLGYLPIPTPEEIEKARKERDAAQSLTKGGEMILVEPFARMGMLNTEIVKASRIRAGEHFTLEQVSNAVKYLRRTGAIERPKRTPVENTEVNKQRAESQEAIEKRVRSWLDTEVILGESGLTDLPTGRNEWLLLSGWFDIKREAADPDQTTQFHERLAALPAEDIERLKPGFDVIETKAEEIRNNQSDITEAPRDEDQIARQSIRQMLEERHGFMGQNRQEYQELLTRVPLTSFLRSGLLEMLHARFNGDIEEALRFAYPNYGSKPLLAMDNVRPGDPLYDEWLQRREQIDSRIRSTMTKRERGSMMVYKDRKNRRKRPEDRWVKISTNEQENVKISPERWWRQENHDLSIAINDLIKPGDRVASVLGGHDAVIPSWILNRLGTNGRLYVITPGRYLEEGLFANFFDQYVNFQAIKGEGDTYKTKEELRTARRERNLTGTEFIDRGFRRRVANFLTNLYSSDEEFYASGLDWKKAGLMQEFFERFGIHPVRFVVPGFPADLPRGSMDALIEADRLSEISEGDKERVLREMDKLLKPGGLLIFRENAAQQTNIEYYAQELLAQRYERVRPRGRGLRSGQIIIFRKRGSESKYVEVVMPVGLQKPETGEAVERIVRVQICEIQHSWDLEKTPDNEEEFRSKLAGAFIHGLVRRHELEGGEVIPQTLIDQSLKDKLTISWFRKFGLLQPLMTEFQGDIGKAADFILANFRPRGRRRGVNDTGSEAVEQATTTSAPVPRDPTGKDFYTIDDLSKELGIPRGSVRKVVEDNMGIRALGQPTGYAGQSGFSRQAVESRQLRLSYQEYLILRESLRRQNPQPKAKSEKED